MSLFVFQIVLSSQVVSHDISGGFFPILAKIEE